MTLTETLHFGQIPPLPLNRPLQAARLAVHNWLDSHKDNDANVTCHDLGAATEKVAAPLDASGLLRAIHTVAIDSPDSLGRRYSSIAIVGGDRPHTLYVTSASEDVNEHEGEDIHSLVGIKQDPTNTQLEQNNARLAHDNLAAGFPQFRLMSWCTPGLGLYEQPLSWWQALALSFEDIASEDLNMQRAISRDKKVHLTAFSMGTLAAAHLVRLNAELPPGQQMELAGFSAISPAWVKPEEAFDTYVRKFLPAAYYQKYGSLQASRLEAAALISKELYRLQKPVVGNAWQLRKGISTDILMDIPRHVRTLIMYGTEDQLAKPDLYTSMARAHPGRAHIIQFPERGHFIGDYIDEVVDALDNSSSFGNLSTPVN